MFFYVDRGPLDSSATIIHFLKLADNKKKRTDYISKNYVDRLDLSVLDHIKNISFFISSYSFEKTPKNCRKHTILATLHSKKLLIHFFTFVESDSISKWKIYDIITEQL